MQDSILLRNIFGIICLQIPKKTNEVLITSLMGMVILHPYE
jgi:hypothetical protein